MTSTLPKPLKYRESPEGWHSVTSLLENTLIAEGVKVIQIKEKFAELRVYADIPKGLTQQQEDDIAFLIDVAELACANMCQVCGEHGEVKSKSGWIAVMCDKHYKDWLNDWKGGTDD